MHAELVAPRTQLLIPADRTAGGAAWMLRDIDDRHCMALMQQAQVPEIIARLLCSRGVSCEDAAHYLQPSLRHGLPNPSELKDMDRAAERLAAAVMTGEAIGIFGDYDVDGATSSALLYQYFTALGAKVHVHIPDRMKEGYGPNAPALLGLKAKGAGVVITVDCGTAAYEPLREAFEAGLDVVVVDHHLGDAELPKAYAVVNPNRFDENGAYGQLAAVGVAFLFAVAVNRALRKSGWFAIRREPDLRQWLDLVALGTVCDVVPLTGPNRVFVAQGLKVMAARSNIGLKALMDIAGLDEKPGVYHAGFLLGPRINAGGRVGLADLGVKLLSCGDPVEAASLARQLDQFNAERKAIETLVLEQAMEKASADQGEGMLLVAGENWHPGVIGIVAGRLKERCHRPVAVIALENGIGKASARSVPGVDLGAAVTAARASGLLLAGGGHAMAAGFTVAEANIPKLRDFLNERILSRSQDYIATRSLMLDGCLHPGGVTPALADMLENAGPFGMGNPQPRFMVKDAVPVKVDIVGNGNVRTVMSAADGSPARLVATAFRAADDKLGEMLLKARGRRIHLAGTVRINRWQGRESAEMTIEDAAEALP